MRPINKENNNNNKKTTPIISSPSPVKQGEPELTRFMDLKSDYGFKAIFGSPNNENLAIDFLNAVLQGRKVVHTITYIDKELLGPTKSHRTAIVDILCNSGENDQFIIELQRVNQLYFKDRAIFYTSSVIVANAPKGNMVDGEPWNYEQQPIFFIGLLDFELENTTPETFQYYVRLRDEIQGKLFYDKLSYIFLELPKFAKQLVREENLSKLSPLEKWLYTIKNMERFSTVPKFMQKGPFKKVVEMSEVKNMNEQQLAEYQQSLRRLWDEQGIKDGAFEEGKKEGKKEAEKAIKEANEKAEKVIKEANEKAEIAEKEKAEALKQANEKAEMEKVEAIKKLLKSDASPSQCAHIFTVEISLIEEIQKSMQLKGELKIK